MPSSIWGFLQFTVDVEVLLDEAYGAVQGMSGLLRGEALESAVSDAVVLAQIAVHCFKAVVGLASDLVGFLALAKALPADDSLVGEASADIVHGGTTRDELLGVSFVGRQNMGDRGIVGVEQLRQIAVGEKASLLVSLLAQA
jgi:hypothetical protein